MCGLEFPATGLVSGYLFGKHQHIFGNEEVKFRLEDRTVDLRPSKEKLSWKMRLHLGHIGRGKKYWQVWRTQNYGRNKLIKGSEDDLNGPYFYVLPS